MHVLKIKIIQAQVITICYNVIDQNSVWMQDMFCVFCVTASNSIYTVKDIIKEG